MINQKQNKNYKEKELISLTECRNMGRVKDNLWRYGTDIFNKNTKTTVSFDCDTQSVIHCENCQTTHNNLEILGHVNDVEEAYSLKRCKEFKVSKIVCKNCGEFHDINEIKVINKAAQSYGNNSWLVYATRYNDDHLVKLSFKICTIMVHKKFSYNDFKHKIVFNTKTGQTYLCNHSSNKKTKARIIMNNKSVSNITYSANIMDIAFNEIMINAEDSRKYMLDIKKNLYNEIYQGISSNLGYNPTHIEDYAKEAGIEDLNNIYTFKNIALYNRFPNLNTFYIENITYLINKKGLFFGMKRLKSTSNNPIKDLAEIYNIKYDDVLYDLFVKGKTDSICDLVIFSRVFDSKEYINNLLKTEGNFFYGGHYADFRERILSRNGRNSILKFLKYISKHRSEEYLYNMCKKCKENSIFGYLIEKLANEYSNIKSHDRYVLDKKDYILKSIDNFLSFDLSELKFNGISQKCIDEEVSSVRKLLIDNVAKRKQKCSNREYSFEVKHLSDYKNSCNYEHRGRKTISEYEHDILNIYKTYPIFNPYVLHDMFYELNEFNHVLSDIGELSSNIMQDLFNYYEIPSTKSLRTLILNNPKKFSSLAFYSNIFKDVNLLRNLVLNASIQGINVSTVREIIGKGDKLCNDSIYGDICKFLKYLVSEQGETLAARKIIDVYNQNLGYALRDTARMYIIYLGLYPNEKLDVSGSLKDLHDRLIIQTGGTGIPLVKKDLKPFKYAESMYDLEYEADDYKFYLAKTGKELIDVGTQLHNCVRSYINDVRMKRCLIVALTYKGEYKVCIELRFIKKEIINEDGKQDIYEYRLNQAKLDSNKPVFEESEVLKVVEEWMTLNNIKNYSSDLGYGKRVESNEYYDEYLPF